MWAAGTDGAQRTAYGVVELRESRVLSRDADKGIRAVVLAESARISLTAGEAGELAAIEDRHLACEVAVVALGVVATPLAEPSPSSATR